MTITFRCGRVRDFQVFHADPVILLTFHQSCTLLSRRPNEFVWIPALIQICIGESESALLYKSLHTIVILVTIACCYCYTRYLQCWSTRNIIFSAGKSCVEGASVPNFRFQCKLSCLYITGGVVILTTLVDEYFQRIASGTELMPSVEKDQHLSGPVFRPFIWSCCQHGTPIYIFLKKFHCDTKATCRDLQRVKAIHFSQSSFEQFLEEG